MCIDRRLLKKTTYTMTRLNVKSLLEHSIISSGKTPRVTSHMILEHEGEYLIVIPHSWVSIRKLLLPLYNPTFIIIIIFEILKPRWRDVMETIYSFQLVDIA